jgi:hypothetical protein
MRNTCSISVATLLALLAASILLPSAQAQLGSALGSGNLSASNQLRVWVADSSRAASYLNDFDLQYTSGPWLVGARFELDEEDRYDPERLLGIKRRFAEYRDEHATIRAGTFYATFGRGLLMRAQEDETVHLDRDIDGLYGAVRWKALDSQGFVGRPRNDETYARDDLLSGVELGVRIHPQLHLGTGYVRLDASDPLGESDNADDPSLGDPLEEFVGGNLQWTHGALDATFEAAKRFVWGERNPRGGWTGVSGRDGEAYYGSLSLAVPGYTCLLEGKDYLRFDAPYSTLPPANNTGQPVNDGRDERGFGLTVTASPRAEITMEASVDRAAARAGDGERSSAEGTFRRDWWGRGAIQLGGEWTEEIELESHEYRRYYGPVLEASYYLSQTTSLTLHGKILDWINHVRGAERVEYTEVSADLCASFGSSRTVTVSVIKATELIPEHDDDAWVSLQFSWSFGYNHDLMIKIGEERGGVVCSGGICRYEPPFTGVRIALLSRL